MAGPMAAGSLMFCSICTRPMRVPTMPMAGAMAPMVSRIWAPLLWRAAMLSISVCSMVFRSAGSWPSTAICRALTRNWSSTWSMESCRLRMPPLRALVANSIIWAMRALVLVSRMSTVFLKIAMVPRTSARGKLIRATPAVPPNTMAMEGRSMNRLSGPPMRMAQIIRPKETTIPIMVAMSTLLLVWETAVEVGRAGWPGGASVPAFQPEGKPARTMPV